MPEPQNELGSNPYLWPNLQGLPYFRALLRSVEAAFYQGLQFPRPILDVGSGDGHFASVAFDFKIDVGIDPWGALMPEARRYEAYHHLVVSDGAELPFPDGYFASALSNSVLEHITHLDDVLAETARVLRPGAPFVFCVPNHQWLENLSVPPVLRRLGLKRQAEAYAAWFRKISRHYHMYDPAEWRRRLEAAGFELEDCWHYFAPASLHVLEWGHYFGLPSLLARKLTGRWLLAPARWNLALTERMLRPHAVPTRREDGTYSFYLARRR